MNQPPDTAGNYEIALANAAKGYVSIPLLPGTKIPAVKWKEWQTTMPTPELYRRWFQGTRNNIAIITTGLVIFDCDDAALAGLVLEQCGDTPFKLRTPRGGIHLGYRARKGVRVGNHVKIKGKPIDIRAENGLELQPFSVTERGAYEWLGAGLIPKSELPVARVGWTRVRVRRRAVQVVIDDGDSTVRRAAAYVAKMDAAVAGQGGHNKTFRVTCRLVHPAPRGFGLSPDQAWPILLAYNARCSPEWPERELRHKLDDALKKR
jgi:hypothetical protein